MIVSLRHQNQHKSSHNGVAAVSAAAHIPYRNSVLTSMLRDSLGGNCRSCFVLTMSLDSEHFSESVSTCRLVIVACCCGTRNSLWVSLHWNCVVLPSYSDLLMMFIYFRFGQRCGEVKVHVHANTEVGLSDQLKELNTKVKHLSNRGEIFLQLSTTLSQDQISSKYPRFLKTIINKQHNKQNCISACI